MTIVELDMAQYLGKIDAEVEMLVRLKLRGAGIPLQPDSTTAVTHGVLEWRDDLSRPNIRVITWRNSDSHHIG